jgi:Zn-dependent protease/predicted transcriptional regulator
MNAKMGRDWSAGLRGVALILALFACVVLHEFGHALTAKHYKIKTRDITIYPIGGIASLENMPEKPMQELLVALAGPAVNVVIAAVLWIYLKSAGLMPDMETLKQAGRMENLSIAFNLLVANIGLAVFNLIPAFPMDGGRILRAILAFRMKRARATRIAAVIGQFLAIVFVFLGFFYNFWLVFIGLFVYLGAGSEAAYESMRNMLAGNTVQSVLMTRFTALSPEDNLEKAVHLLLEGQEQDFLVVSEGQVQGVLTRKELIHGLSAFGKSAPISNIMREDFISLTPHMNLQEVYSLMITNNCTVYPVQENGKLLGMVNKENINELIMVQQAAT